MPGHTRSLVKPPPLFNRETSNGGAWNHDWNGRLLSKASSLDPLARTACPRGGFAGRGEPGAGSPPAPAFSLSLSLVLPPPFFIVPGPPGSSPAFDAATAATAAAPAVSATQLMMKFLAFNRSIGRNYQHGER